MLLQEQEALHQLPVYIKYSLLSLKPNKLLEMLLTVCVRSHGRCECDGVKNLVQYLC